LLAKLTPARRFLLQSLLSFGSRKGNADSQRYASPVVVEPILSHSPLKKMCQWMTQKMHNYFKPESIEQIKVQIGKINSSTFLIKVNEEFQQMVIATPQIVHGEKIKNLHNWLSKRIGH
jgi:Cft2 family RNA processing exonuclease